MLVIPNPPKLINLCNILRVKIQHTSNHFIATCNASTAFLAAPRTLSTSSQHKNFFCRKELRAEVISYLLAVGSLTRCLCHDLHAYCKAWLMYFSVLSSKSSTSEFLTASGR